MNELELTTELAGLQATRSGEHYRGRGVGVDEEQRFELVKLYTGQESRAENRVDLDDQFLLDPCASLVLRLAP